MVKQYCFGLNILYKLKIDFFYLLFIYIFFYSNNQISFLQRQI